MRHLLLPLLLLLPLVAGAAIEVHKFDDPRKEQTYKELIEELRCLVCQNQNLADSNADLAKDLREKTYEMVEAGKSKEQIIDWMVNRYGDFVLYKPPLQRNTLLLWGGPFIILLVGIGVLVRFIRRRPSTTEHLLTEEQRRKAEALLEGKEEQ
jgi:cytochrome c-type biogenesis protein CcmH